MKREFIPFRDLVFAFFARFHWLRAFVASVSVWCRPSCTTIGIAVATALPRRSRKFSQVLVFPLLLRFTLSSWHLCTEMHSAPKRGLINIAKRVDTSSTFPFFFYFFFFRHFRKKETVEVKKGVWRKNAYESLSVGYFSRSDYDAAYHADKAVYAKGSRRRQCPSWA